MTRPQVLVVDDDEDCAAVVQRALQETIPGIQVEVAYNVWQAQQALEQGNWACFLVDLRLGKASGMDFLAATRETAPHAARILMTAYPTFEGAMRAVNDASVHALLSKPLDLQRLARTVQAALREAPRN